MDPSWVWLILKAKGFNSRGLKSLGSLFTIKNKVIKIDHPGYPRMVYMFSSNYEK